MMRGQERGRTLLDRGQDPFHGGADFVDSGAAFGDFLASGAEWRILGNAPGVNAGPPLG